MFVEKTDIKAQRLNDFASSFDWFKDLERLDSVFLGVRFRLGEIP